MKCLHILPMNKLSGAERMVLILCKNMKRYDPIVVCGGEDLSDIFKKDNIPSYSLSFSTKDMLKTLKGLKKIVKENDIKIVHAHDNLASINAYLIKKLYGLDIKVISHIHNCYPWLVGNNSNRVLDSFFRVRYDHNITCGKMVYDYYKNNANYFQPQKTTILSNAMDVDEIIKLNMSKNEEIVKRYNIATDKVVLGFIGRLSEQKGIIPFIKEFAHHKEDFKDCRVLLVGNGEQENMVRELIKELELEELFILTGYQEDVYRFYPIIDVFFLPSLYEGLPMVILEAMVFKKPVVSMKVGSIGEVIIDNFNGCLIEAQNYRSFVKALQKLKDNKDTRNKYSDNSFLTVNEGFDIKVYAEKLIDIYDKLLS